MAMESLQYRNDEQVAPNMVYITCVVDVTSDDYAALHATHISMSK